MNNKIDVYIRYCPITGEALKITSKQRCGCMHGYKDTNKCKYLFERSDEKVYV